MELLILLPIGMMAKPCIRLLYRPNVCSCALANSLKPGILPNHRELDPNNALANAQLGTDVAEKELEIPKGSNLFNELLIYRLPEI